MDDKFIVRGGKPLCGSVVISGAKNAAVAIIPAALLCEEECIIDNLPNISDVAVLVDILSSLGATVEMETEHRMRISAANVSSWHAPFEKVKAMRASYYLMGVLLGRFGKAEVALPGGCEIGVRPMDQHIKGFQALGATAKRTSEGYYLEADPLIGGECYLDMASVGATINIMLAAVLAKGNTIIANAAKEPHVVDLANFLSSMGAKIKGAGTNTIRITGVSHLHGCTYSIIPDQIESGTMMIAAAATGGDVLVTNVIPPHLDSITGKLIESGCRIDYTEDTVHIIGPERPRPLSISTMPYPGFPTDLQQPITAYLSRANGTSVVTENIYESRFRYVDELLRMGAQIRVAGRIAIVDGVDQLHGTSLTAWDLRAGAAMIVAALSAEGESQIHRLRYIDRGYANIEQKLRSLGADIVRVPDSDSLMY